MWASTAESFDRPRNCSWIASTNSRRRFSRALETSSRLRRVSRCWRSLSSAARRRSLRSAACSARPAITTGSMASIDCVLGANDDGKSYGRGIVVFWPGERLKCSNEDYHPYWGEITSRLDSAYGIVGRNRRRRIQAALNTSERCSGQIDPVRTTWDVRG